MLAIVPVRGRNGKHRLDGFLSAGERSRLVAAMLADVTRACSRAESVAATLVVTPDPRIAPEGADVLADEGAGHEEAIACALADPRARAGALVVMADCPLVTPQALDRLARSARPIALVPARDGGLNALALSESGVVDPVFGVPGAAAEMLARARSRGLEPAVLDEPSLAFDVDDPADVWEVRRSGGGTTTQAFLGAVLPPTGGLR